MWIKKKKKERENNNPFSSVDNASEYHVKKKKISRRQVFCTALQRESRRRRFVRSIQRSISVFRKKKNFNSKSNHRRWNFNSMNMSFTDWSLMNFACWGRFYRIGSSYCRDWKPRFQLIQYRELFLALALHQHYFTRIRGDHLQKILSKSE